MNQKTLQKIAEMARRDPEFFHALVFSPAQVLSQLDFIDAKTKQQLAGMDPQQMLTGLLAPAGGSVMPEIHCNPTCDGNTCGYTCSGGGSCGYTCNSPSCGVTCKRRSCATTGFAPQTDFEL